MSMIGAVGTPDIRRRVPSSHHGESSIRVISCSSSAAPRSGGEVRPYARRKPVVLSSSDVEEDTREADVARASNTLRDQVSGSEYHRSSPDTVAGASVPLSPLLPSPIIDVPSHIDKARWSDQPSDDGERDSADGTIADTIIIEQSLENKHSPLSQTLAIDDESTFLGPTSATITLESIGRSLQWTQKFPQGRHLSRAKSRTTLRSADSVTAISTDDGRSSTTKDQLAEARAGLRLLAKRREDVLQDHDDLIPSRAAKWNSFKWALFISVLIVFAYGILGLIASLLTWAGAWDGAEVSVTVDTDIVILMTVASALCLTGSIVGIVGSVLNSRPILALYAFLLWPALVSLLAVGYTSYKRTNLRLDLKLNQTWSRYMDDLARLRVQDILHCCGYYNTIHQATFSRDCYPRTTLPGCKGNLYRFEMRSLRKLYIITFCIVFVHLGAIAASILCSNHVNVTFGKGLTPRSYRLDVGHVRRNAVNIIRMLSSNASDSSNVHHHLEVDKIEPICEEHDDNIFSRKEKQ